MPISSSKYIKWDKQVDLIWRAERKMRNEKSPLFYRVVIWKINCIFTKTIHEFGFLKHKETHSLDFLSESKCEVHAMYLQYKASLNQHSISCFQKKYIQTLVDLKKTNNKEIIVSGVKHQEKNVPFLFQVQHVQIYIKTPMQQTGLLYLLTSIVFFSRYSPLL